MTYSADEGLGSDSQKRTFVAVVVVVVVREDRKVEWRKKRTSDERATSRKIRSDATVELHGSRSSCLCPWQQ